MKIQQRPPAPVLGSVSKVQRASLEPVAPERVAASKAPVALTLSPSEGRPVTAASSLGWEPKGFWLDQTMLKPPPPMNLSLDDVEGGPPALGVELPVLLATDNRQQVFEKLKNVPLERMLVSPGYRYYRHPEQFPEVLAQVKANQRVDTRPSIIDVHTDGKGRVTNVDLRSHHLRMAAFLETGARTLGELPFDQVLIKVDGQQREDKVWLQKVHGYALPAEVLAKQGVHVVADQQDPATVEIDNLQNFELGSRTSLKRFHETLLHREQPKVGLLLGGDVEAALRLRDEKGLDEVVLAPVEPLSDALLEQVRQTDGVNLYLDRPVSLRETFPDIDYATLVKYRLNLIYGVDMHGIVTT